MRIALKHHAALAVAVMLAGLLTSGAVQGFGTIRQIGQDAEHEKITRRGLVGLGIGSDTMDEIAGKTGTFGAVGSPDWRLTQQKSAHCDGGDWLDLDGYPQSQDQALAILGECRDWIFSKLAEAVQDAGAIADDSGSIDTGQIPSIIACKYTGTKGRAKCNVLEDLGIALHAAQDFYSHSNWVDQPTPDADDPLNPPGLGNNGRARWLDPRFAGEGPPDGLMSGCFGGIPEALFCKYAGGKPRVRHGVLNKDKGAINGTTGAPGTSKTPRGKIGGNFGRAVDAAAADTRDKWLYFEASVRATYPGSRSEAILCALKQDNPDGC